MLCVLQVSRLEGACASKPAGASIRSFLLGAKKKAPGMGMRPARVPVTDASPGASETSVSEKRNPEVLVNDSQECDVSRQECNADQSSDAGHVPSGTHEPTTESNNTSSSESKSIDMEVLLALPEDMRSQVIAEYQQQGYIIPTLPGGTDSGNTRRNVVEALPLPSTSGYVAPAERQKLNAHTINQLQSVVDGAETSRKIAGGNRSELKREEDSGNYAIANRQNPPAEAAARVIQDVAETSNSSTSFSTVTENAQDSALITSFSQVSIYSLLYSHPPSDNKSGNILESSETLHQTVISPFPSFLPTSYLLGTFSPVE